MSIKHMTKTTIRNATRQELLDFIADMTQDYPYDNITLVELRQRVRECEKKSVGWFGGIVTFEGWING